MTPVARPRQGWFGPRSGPLGPYSSFVVGFVLLAAGVLGLIVFMNTPGALPRPEFPSCRRHGDDLALRPAEYHFERAGLACAGEDLVRLLHTVEREAVRDQL